MKWIERSIWIVLVVVLAGGVFVAYVIGKFYHESVGIAVVNDVGSKAQILQLIENGEIEAAENRLRYDLVYGGATMHQLADHYGYGRPGGSHHISYKKATDRLEALDLPTLEEYKYTPVTRKDAP